MSIRALRASCFALVVASGCAAEQKASIGAVLARDNETGALTVREVSPGLASARAGLLPGDELVMIDGRYVRDLDAQAVRTSLRGELGTAVHVTVVRGEEVVRLRIERGALREAVEEKPRVETIAE